MSINFSSVINEIMPFVNDADNTTPFIISLDSESETPDWIVCYPYPAENAEQFLANQKKYDPLALMFTGEDFAYGSYPYVYDKVLCERVWAEYNNIQADEENLAEFHALAEFFEEHLGALNSETAEYIANLASPLEWISNVSPFSLRDGYDEDTETELLEMIETQAELSAEADLNKQTQREIETLIESGGISVGYEANPDRGFIDKIRSDYSSSKTAGESLFNLMRFMKNHSCELSNDAKEYLMSIDSPLEWLGKQLGESGKSREFETGDDGGLISEIENIVDGARMDEDYEAGFIDTSSDNFSTISSISLYGYEIKLVENTKQPQPFYVEALKNGETVFSLNTDKYAEALKAYTGQILEREDKAVEHGAEYVKLTGAHCLTDSKNANFTGKLIIVDADMLKPEYRSSTSQLMQCTHGNGARPDAIGTSVFGKELYSGEKIVYGRHEILGIADESKLPQWAKAKLAEQRGEEPPPVTPTEKPPENKYTLISHGQRGEHDHGDFPTKAAAKQYANECGLTNITIKPIAPTKNTPTQNAKKTLLGELNEAKAEAAEFNAGHKGGNQKKRNDMEVD